MLLRLAHRTCKRSLTIPTRGTLKPRPVAEVTFINSFSSASRTPLTKEESKAAAKRRVELKNTRQLQSKPTKFGRRSPDGSILPRKSPQEKPKKRRPSTKRSEISGSKPSKGRNSSINQAPSARTPTKHKTKNHKAAIPNLEKMSKRALEDDNNPAKEKRQRKFKMSGKLKRSEPEFRARVSLQRQLVECFKNTDVSGAFKLYRNRSKTPMPEDMIVPEDQVQANDPVAVVFTPDMQALLLKTVCVAQEHEPDAASECIDDILELYESSKTTGIDENQYAVLLELFSNMGRVDDVKSMFKELKDTGETPRLRHFAPVLSAIAGSIGPQQVCELDDMYTEMLETTLRSNDAVADAHSEPDQSSSVNEEVGSALAHGRDSRNSGTKALRLVMQLPTEREYSPILSAISRLGSSEEALQNDKVANAINSLLTRVLADMAWDVPQPVAGMHKLIAQCFASPLANKLGSQYGNASTEQSQESSTEQQWSVSEKPVQLSAEGTCPRCQTPMRAFDADNEELQLFMENIEVNATSRRNSSKAWSDFKTWLSSGDIVGYDTVVDGANLAYYANAHFSHEGLNLCWKEILKTGRSPLLILHERHFAKHVIKGNVAAQEAIKEWEASGRLYKVPRGNNDDWYWLYAAMVKGPQSGIQLISNDQMRDHHLRMNLSRFFKKWRERHMVNFHYHLPSPRSRNDFKLQLFEPLPYSLRPQSNVAGTSWHFPVGDPEEAERKLKNFDEESNLHRKAAQNMSKWLKKQYNSRETPWTCIAQQTEL